MLQQLDPAAVACHLPIVIEAAANATPGDHTLKIELVPKYNGVSLNVSQSIPLKIEAVAQAAKK